MRSKILIATLATFLSLPMVWAQPIRLSPYGTSPDTSGQDQLNNIGTVVTNPTATSAPTAVKNPSVIAPAATDRASSRSPSYVQRRDEVPSEQPMNPANKLETLVPQSQGGQALQSPGQQPRPEQQVLPAHP